MVAAPTAIRIRELTKTFGSKIAVDRLELEIPSGTLCGVIGPNGAGKTTTIRMIMSILFPDAGELEVLGHGSALDAKDRIGYLPEERGVYRKMKVAGFLKHIGRLKGVPDAVLAGRIDDLLDRVELAHTADKRCEELSKGMLQKVQFAAAIINEPDLIILDEPFSGLDPVSMRLLREQVIAEHRRGATILFSTHVMQQAEEICERVIMIHEGRKVLDDPIPAILSRHNPRTLVFSPLRPDVDVAPLRAIDGVEDLAHVDGHFELMLDERADPAEAMRALVGAIPVARVELARPRLEDIFVQLVSTGASERHELRGQLKSVATGDAP